MKISLRAAMLATTAIVGFATPASADPITTAVVMSAAGSVGTAIVTGAAISWTAVAGTALVAGALAGVAMLTAPKPQGPSAQDITLNRIQPVTTGLILYGERTLGGTIVARSTTPANGKQNARYHSVIPLACHEIEGPVAAYIGETKVWTKEQFDLDASEPDTSLRGQIDSDYKGKFRMRFYNGTATQEAEPRYVSAASEWTAAHRGRGIAYVYFEADYNADVFPRGVEQLRVRCRGKKLFDPRTSTTAYSNNPALIARDYVLTPEAQGGVGWTADDIDEASIINLANLSDEQITISGGTENRYAFDGVFDTGIAPETNLNILSTSWGGWWTVDRGRLSVGGGAYEAPTVTITEDDMAGPIKVRARRPFEQQFNLVKAVYADPENEHVPTDLPVLASTVYRAQDNGEELVRDLGEMPGETSFSRGQRLMKLALLKGRRQRMVDVPCTLAVWDVALGDNVRLDVPRRGWDSKTFEVVGRTATIASNKVQVGLSLVENGPDVYDWTTSEETPKPAGGVPTLPSPTDPPLVQPPLMTETLYSSRGGGGVKVKVTLTSDSDSPAVDLWQFSYRLLSDAEATLGPSTKTPDQEFDDFTPGIYEFGARATTRRGITSEWAYTTQEVYGLNATPAAITGLSAAVVSGMITLRWTQHPDLDVRQGGLVEVRHSADLNATWQTSTSIGKAVPGSATMTTLPAISGRYLLRATDSQGVPGSITTINTTAPDFQSLTTLATVTESTAFAGTKTNCTVSGSALQLDAGQTLATYVFSGSMNFGALRTARLSSILSVLIADRSDLFDSDELFDSAALFDGSGDAEGDVNIYYRASETSGTDWGDWVEFDRTDVRAWRVEFKAELTSASDNFRTDILTLGVTAEGL